MWRRRGEQIEIPSRSQNQKDVAFEGLNDATRESLFHVLSVTKGGKNSAQFLAWRRKRVGHTHRRRQRIILLIDNGPIHTAKKVDAFLEEPAIKKLIRTEWLPTYARDLHDQERVWTFVKEHGVANVVFAGRDSLRERVVTLREALHRDPQSMTMIVLGKRHRPIYKKFLVRCLAMEEAREHCGLAGVFGSPNAAELTYLGLFALQHRGQESAGIAVNQGGRIGLHKGMGLVASVFPPDILHKLQGLAAVGHVRYSTTGSSNAVNAQPLVVETPHGMIALAHNGNLVNSASLRRSMESQGRFFPLFHTSTDTETILALAARSAPLAKSLPRTLAPLRGAYSLLFLTPREMVAVRDPQGFRPLALGRRGGAWAVASETCALDLMGFTYQRDIEPGEILVIDRRGPWSGHLPRSSHGLPAHCLFEHIYFARPDSWVHGDLVQAVRHRLGRRLAQDHPVPADLVVPVPDSGIYAALGYAEESRIPFQMAYVRNHYVGRTFIQPHPYQRSSSVTIKLSVIRELVQKKRLVVVDDSVIRGTTSRSRIQLLRDAGAREIHLRISCPPTRFPCYYGIDFPDAEELIAARKDVEAVRRHVGADTLGYLGLEGLLAAVSGPPDHYCTACWTGRYPVPPEGTMSKSRHEPGGRSGAGGEP